MNTVRVVRTARRVDKGTMGCSVKKCVIAMWKRQVRVMRGMEPVCVHLVRNWTFLNLPLTKGPITGYLSKLTKSHVGLGRAGIDQAPLWGVHTLGAIFLLWRQLR